MLNQLCKHKLKAKHSKCEFAYSSVKYLGHVAGFGESRDDSDIVLAVADWAEQSNIKGV